MTVLVVKVMLHGERVKMRSRGEMLLVEVEVREEDEREIPFAEVERKAHSSL